MIRSAPGARRRSLSGPVAFVLLCIVCLRCLAAPAVAQTLPPVPVPAGNPLTAAKATLGKLLFWEEQMSSDNRVACGTCHLPAFGGGDGRRAVHPGPDGVVPSPDDLFGSPGIVRSDANNEYLPSSLFGLAPQVTSRASPSVLTAAWFPELFWDGRAPGRFVEPEHGTVSLAAGGALESQATAPVLEAVEMAHDLRRWPEVVQKLTNVEPMALATGLPPDMATAIAGGTRYPALFHAAFGDPAITAERIAFALASYQRTLVPDQTPYDLFVRGNPTALTMRQQGGLNVFNGPGRCNLCHTPGLFSDRQFRNLGLRPIADDRGRQDVTGNTADRGKFKVPSLRNVGLRRSFMHTGQFTSLPQVFGFYLGGGGPVLDNKDPLLRPLQVPPQAADALIDFLTNGLTDPRVRNGQFPFDRPTLASERIPPRGVLIGAGSTGTGGRVPALLAGVPANLGNVDWKLGVADALGGAPATLALSLRQAPPGAQILGVPVHADVWGVATFVGMSLSGTVGTAGAGHGTFRLPLPREPALRGLDVFAQAFVWDAGAASGAAVTPGARISLF